jgi:hypothetical protein
MTRNKLEKLAQEAGWSGLYIHWAEPDNKPDWRPFKTSLTVPVTMEQIERFAALVAAHEAEACAELCHKYAQTAFNSSSQNAAVELRDAIWARRQG